MKSSLYLRVVPDAAIRAFLFPVLLLLLFGGHQTACAIDASPDAVDVKQPDGTVVKLSVHGDEWFHWYQDSAGFTVMPDRAGGYVYATLDADGKLAPTALRPGKDKPDVVGLKQGILPAPDVRRSYRKMANGAQAASASAGVAGLAAPDEGGPALIQPNGTVKNLVILCKFADHTLGVQTRQSADYDVVMNSVGGNATLAPTGSVRDYYTQVSYGKMVVQSTVVGWVTLPQTESYYADGNSGFNAYPKNAQKMVEDALAAADGLVDFGQFDTDNDGYIDAITIIHSGYGDETGGGGGNWIWSHRWSLPGDWVSADNNGSGVKVKVKDYHTEPALWSTSGNSIVRIGVICHELGHFFGLPDLYDTDYSSKGLGSWCLMANAWGFDGTQQHPPHFSAWCKVSLGWVTPAVVSTGTQTALRVETSPSIFKITAGFPANEYLLIENRQPYGFESTVPSGGLAIWHIDETKTSNRSEGYPGQAGWPGNNNHYEIALLQADGQYHLEKNGNNGDSGDLYRAGGTSAILTSTVPNTDRYQGGVVSATGNSITNISASSASMTFAVNASVTGPPVITSAPTASGSTGASFNYQIAATNVPTSYAATGLPPGLAVTTSTGAITGAPTSAGTYPVSISATNSFGTGSGTVTMTIAQGISLSTALDTTGVTWTTGGNSNWTTVASPAHDGTDSARSGVPGDAQESWAQASFTGPGNLDFWWSVSSQVNHDYLYVLLDGGARYSISGEVPWEQRTINIPSGTHTVRWRYLKDSSLSGGSDAGYLDAVVYTPGVRQPVITSATSASAISGQTFSYQITANYGPTSYNATGLPAGLSVNTTSGLISGTPAAVGTSIVNLSAINSAGTGTATLTLTVQNSITLAQALDDSSLVWATGGNAGWTGQISVTHDLNDAGRSGTITDSQESWAQTVVTGPGTINFWWNVSSETNYDFLRFEVDGVQQDAISGTVAWEQKSFTIGVGQHALRWRYAKDTSVSTSADAGYLDQVTWAANAFLPVITSPNSATGVVNLNMTFQVTAINSPTSYAASGLPPGVTIDTVTGLISGVPTTTGTFIASLSASNAAGTATQLLTFTVSSSLTLELALDRPGLTWSSGGNAQWKGQTTTTHDGSDAGQSDKIGDSQESWVETTIAGPGTLTFWWSVSSEAGFDFLSFSIDGTEQAAISGLSGWQQKTFELTSGTHVCRWRYAKDTAESAGADMAWLDQVSFSPGLQTPVFISAAATEGQTGEYFLFQLQAANSATTYGASSLPPGLSIIPSSGYIYGYPTSVGTYSVPISATNSTGTTNGTLYVTISSSLSIGAALENSELAWTSGGNVGPFATTGTSYDGVDCVQTGDVSDSQSSYVQTTVTGPAVLAFWWAVSSETNYDTFAFQLDGVTQFSISGTTGTWEARAVAIGAGSHTCRWRYLKDSSVSLGADAGFLDQVSVARAAAIQSPVAGYVFTADPVTITWDTGFGATAYALWVGSTPGGYDLYANFEGTNLSKTLSGMPDDGRAIYVTLYSWVQGAWQADTRSYVAYTGPSPLKARLVSPANGSMLTGLSLPLVWDAGTSVTQYAVWVGTVPGAYNLYAGLEGTNLSRTVTVPADGKIYVTLWSYARGSWRSNSYYFNAVPSVRAALANPTPDNGSTLAEGNLFLNWTPGTGVSAYYVWIGSYYGGYDLGAAAAGTDTSRTFTVPTDGRPVYVTLWSLINGAFVSNSYWFITASTSSPRPAHLTSPAQASTAGAASVNFTWDGSVDASQYYLFVGSSAGGYDLYIGDEGTDLSHTVTLPGDGRRAYVTLYSRIGGVWRSCSYYFTCANVPTPAAQLSGPANNSLLADGNLALSWNAAPEATAYALWVGNSPGGYDIYAGLEGTSLSKTVTVPTDGRLIYATLWSFIRGVWQQNMSWFTESGPTAGGVASRMLNPANGGVLGDVSVTFGWDAGSGVSSRALWLGSSPGAYDLAAVALPSALSYAATLPNDGRKVYATLWSLISGTYKSNQYVYTAVNVAGVKASILTPASGSVISSPNVTITWDAGVVVSQYALWIGRSPKSYDVYAGLEGTSHSKSLSNIPNDGGPVYVTLWSYIRGVWQSNEFVFNTSP